MVPTVVLANMDSSGAAARSNQLNIGDQIMAVNDTSLVGLPLSSSQSHIKVRHSHVINVRHSHVVVVVVIGNVSHDQTCLALEFPVIVTLP